MGVKERHIGLTAGCAQEEAGNKTSWMGWLGGWEPGQPSLIHPF
jgi:hypothetical protein